MTEEILDRGVITKKKSLVPHVRGNKDRVVVTSCVYHQALGRQPIAVDHRFSYDVTEVQPCYRVLQVGLRWTKVLPEGWIEDASILHLFNEEGKFTQHIPTEAEKKDASTKVLELAVAYGTVSEDEGPHLAYLSFADIHPQRNLPLPVSLKVSDYYVRCLHPSGCRYSVHVFPK